MIFWTIYSKNSKILLICNNINLIFKWITLLILNLYVIMPNRNLINLTQIFKFIKNLKYIRLFYKRIKKYLRVVLWLKGIILRFLTMSYFSTWIMTLCRTIFLIFSFTFKGFLFMNFALKNMLPLISGRERFKEICLVISSELCHDIKMYGVLNTEFRQV